MKKLLVLAGLVLLLADLTSLAGDSAQSAVSKPKKVKKQTQAERIDQLEAQVTFA